MVDWKELGFHFISGAVLGFVTGFTATQEWTSAAWTALALAVLKSGCQAVIVYLTPKTTGVKGKKKETSLQKVKKYI